MRSISRRIRVLSGIFLVGVFLLSSPVVWGGELFLDSSNIQNPATQRPSAKPFVKRYRRAAMDVSVLKGAEKQMKTKGNKAAPKITLNLFDDTMFQAVAKKIDSHPKGLDFVGHIEGYENESSVIIVERNGAVSGTVRHEGLLFKIQSGSRGELIIEELDESALPETENDSLLAPEGDSSMQGDSLEKIQSAIDSGVTAADDGTQIDVLVLYTPAAKAAVGSELGMLALIDESIVATNVAYVNSGIGTSLNLVHATETSYTEVDYNTDLDRLTLIGDGFMEEAHTLRDIFHADMVALISNDQSLCGLAWLMTETRITTAFASSAFSVVNHLCSASNLTFAHELGHNMGSTHDFVNASVQGAYPYSYGYQAPDGAFRTVMALSSGCPVPGGCSRVANFSNPNINFPAVTGQPTGVAGAEDNVFSINNNSTVVSNFRLAEVDTIPPAEVTDLSVSSKGMLSITLSWTSTGDDGLIGQAVEYDLRYSTSPIISDADFLVASEAIGEPFPQASGNSEQFELTGLVPDIGYFIALKVIDEAGNPSILSNIVSNMTLKATAFYLDNFESGAPGWTMSGNGTIVQWHLSTDRGAESGHSPITSFVYNDGGTPPTYIDGNGATIGDLISPPIDLSNEVDAFLSFSHWFETEISDLTFDMKLVNISTDGGITWQQIDQILSDVTPQITWQDRVLDLTDYVGQTVQFKFTFQTGDSFDNDFEGWYIDDVSVLTNNPAQFDPIGDKGVAEGNNLNFIVSASDPDGDSLTFSATGLPAGASFDPATQVFNWTPVVGDVGSYNVTFSVTDGSFATTETIVINVWTAAVTSSVVFKTTDTATQGNWKTLYGVDGYNVVNDAVSYPAYLPPVGVPSTEEGNTTWFVGTTNDIRDLERVVVVSERIAAAFWTTSSMDFDIDLTDGLMHQIALYNLDWDFDGREQTVEVIDIGTNTVLDTRVMSGFNGGQYLVWDISGHVKIRVTKTAGANAVVSGIFFGGGIGNPPVLDPIGDKSVDEGSNLNFTVTASDFEGDALTFSVTGLPVGASFDPATQVFNWTPGAIDVGSYNVTFDVSDGTSIDSETIVIDVVSIAVVTSAVFKMTDVSTQGNWKSSYGADGYNVINDAVSYPAYLPPVGVPSTEEGNATWFVGTTSDIRDLERVVVVSERIAAAFWTTSSMDFDIDLTDGLTHQIALYNLDWDNNGRAQTVEVIDAVTDIVLDTQVMSGFNSGKYLVWDISGHVKIRVTKTAGANAVVSGIFFGGGIGNPPVLDPIGNKTVSEGNNLNFTVAASDLDGDPLTFSATGLPAGASFDPATQVFNWTPGAIDVGNHDVTFDVSDGISVDSETITITVLSGAITSSAVFKETDILTKGNWKSTYGIDGYNVVNDAVSYPAYLPPVGVPSTEEGNATWFVGTTSDIRDLERVVVVSERIAAAFWTTTSMEFDIDLTDELMHQIALYNLDWDNNGRAQTVEVIDAGTGIVLNTQSMAGFSGGKYLVWDISGHVKIKVTKTAGANAVVSGIFFGEGIGQPPVLSPIGDKTVLEESNLNFTVSASDLDGDPLTFSVTGLPVGASFSSGTQVFNWTPTLGDFGSYDVTFSVTDGISVDSETITITVFSSTILSSVTFKETDTATQGNWKGVYGADGYNVINDAVSYPAYLPPVGVPSTEEGNATWFVGTTSDIRDLERVVVVSERIAAAFWTTSSMDFDIDLTDGLTHQIAMYNLDWDNNGRAQTVEVIDVASGTVLDAQAMAGFSSGKYLVWDISGHVKIKVTRTAGSNAVVSGLFFDPRPVNQSPVLDPIGSKAVDEGVNLIFTVTASDPESDLLTFSVTGLPAGASFNTGTQVFDWTPSGCQYGIYNPTFNVTDGTNNVSEVVTITVRNTQGCGGGGGGGGGKTLMLKTEESELNQRMMKF